MMEWYKLKGILDANPGLLVKSFQIDSIIHIMVFEGVTKIGECEINSDVRAEDAALFNSNYKPLIEPNLMNKMPATASKVLSDGKKLYKRVVGVKQSLTVGSNDIIWVVPFAWVKFLEAEIVGGEFGDTCSVYVLDKSESPLYGVPNGVLNRFSYDANIAKDFYVRKSEFDADLYQNLQLKIVYNSISEKTVGVNFIMNEVKS